MLIPEKVTDGTAFPFQVQDDSLPLQSEELKLLQEVDDFPYPLLGYANLAALHREVTLIISSDELKYDAEKVNMNVGEVKDIIEQIEKEIEKLKDDTSEDGLREKEALEALKGIYTQASKGKGDNESVEIFFPGKGSILGEYQRDGIGDKPKVILYVNNMLQDNEEINPVLLISTYVHEMMHAYYDTNKNITKVDHYIPCLEEPLAEMGMLRFMQQFRMGWYYLECLDVVRKKKKSGSIACYGFGAYLNEILQDTILPEMMVRTDKPISSPALKEYVNRWKSRIYPFDHEEEVAELMYKVFGFCRESPNYMIAPPATYIKYGEKRRIN